MDAMGQFGRLTSVADLPDEKTLQTLIHTAMDLTDKGVKPARTKHPKPDIAMPDDLRGALDADPKAAATFDGLPLGAQRDYIEWITEADRQGVVEGKSVSVRGALGGPRIIKKKK